MEAVDVEGIMVSFDPVGLTSAALALVSGRQRYCRVFGPRLGAGFERRSGSFDSGGLGKQFDSLLTGGEGMTAGVEFRMGAHL